MKATAWITSSTGRLYESKELLWAITITGLILRLRQYLFDRSLFWDEVWRAAAIVNDPYSSLLKLPAPLGFLAIEKAMVQLFGPTDYVLRAFPFLCSVASLLLFYALAKKTINPKAIPIALGLFAISDPLVFHSSVVKEFSSDILATILVYLAADLVQTRGLTTAAAFLFGVFGGASVWFSRTTAFVLAGVGAGLSLPRVGKRRWRGMGVLSAVFAVWVMSFAVMYYLSFMDMSDSALLTTVWGRFFMPTGFFSVTGVWRIANWGVNTFFNMFIDPVGLYLPGLGALTFLVGCAAVAKHDSRRFAALASPILFTLLASAFGRYPFASRMLLFLVPPLILLIAEGAWTIREKTAKSLPIAGTLVILLMFAQPALNAAYHVVLPHASTEIKPVMEYLASNRREGDAIYVYGESTSSFRFYSQAYGFREEEYIKGPRESSSQLEYLKTVDELRGRGRVWFLFSDIRYRDGLNEERLYLLYLDHVGKRLDGYESPGASVYLYDLR